jgi:hypothetical protein
MENNRNAKVMGGLVLVGFAALAYFVFKSDKKLDGVALKKYKASFIGRKNDAIGKTYKISTIVEGNDENEAKLNLYNRYDLITNLKLKKSK